MSLPPLSQAKKFHHGIMIKFRLEIAFKWELNQPLKVYNKESSKMKKQTTFKTIKSKVALTSQSS